MASRPRPLEVLCRYDGRPRHKHEGLDRVIAGVGQRLIAAIVSPRVVEQIQIKVASAFTLAAERMPDPDRTRVRPATERDRSRTAATPVQRPHFTDPPRFPAWAAQPLIARKDGS